MRYFYFSLMLYTISFNQAYAKVSWIEQEFTYALMVSEQDTTLEELFNDINGNGIPNEPGIETSPPFSHRRVYWDEAGTSPGSSGSGLFNDEKLLVGQLSGGNNDCIDPIEPSDCDEDTADECSAIVGCHWTGTSCIVAIPQDFYGKLSVSQKC